ncbi:MAG: hypothetical protein AB7G47_07915 [Mycolicibacterium sp.]
MFAVTTAAAMMWGGLAGCSAKSADDIAVGDCVRTSGPSDRPEAAKAACGTPESNFKVVAVIAGSAGGTERGTEHCPSDIDSYYSMSKSFSDSRTTICLDIDWVVGGCMSVDPQGGRDPIRADCLDSTLPGRQRATEILKDVANGDQCASGVGYAYRERNFTVCVEHVA